MRRVLIVALVLLFGAGCGGPTEPTVTQRPAPTYEVAAIAIRSGADLIRIRDQLRLQADVTLADGRSLAAVEKVRWGSNDERVATVDAAGLVRGMGAGFAVITATIGDAVGSHRLRVVPDYAGTWRGDYQITTVRCRRTSGTGSTYQMRLELVQTGDLVTGTLALPANDPGNVKGQIGVEGTLRLDGVWDPYDRLGPYVWRLYWLMAWDVTLSAAGDTMAGTFRYGWPDICEVDGRLEELQEQ